MENGKAKPLHYGKQETLHQYKAAAAGVATFPSPIQSNLTFLLGDG